VRGSTMVTSTVTGDRLEQLHNPTVHNRRFINGR
jgi:hypothetical protein